MEDLGLLSNIRKQVPQGMKIKFHSNWFYALKSLTQVSTTLEKKKVSQAVI